MIKKILLIVFMMIALLFLNGCMNLRIQEDVDYPEDLFKETSAKIADIHAKDPHRKGSFSRIHILVYDGEDRELIQLSVKKGMAEKILENNGFSTGKEGNKYTKKYADFDLDGLKVIDRLGPGLLIEVEDMKENSHIIIWLE